MPFPSSQGFRAISQPSKVGYNFGLPLSNYIRPARLAWIAFHVGLIFFSSTSFAARVSDYAFDFYRHALGIDENGLGLHVIAQKGVHFALFFSLGVIVLTSISGGIVRRIGWALAACVMVGSMSEAIQLFVPGRGPSLFDVVLNGSSGLLGACAVTFGLSTRPAADSNAT